MCLVILFGEFLPRPEAARLQQAPMREGGVQAPSRRKFKGAEIRQASPSCSSAPVLGGEETQGSGALNLRLFP